MKADPLTLLIHHMILGKLMEHDGLMARLSYPELKAFVDDLADNISQMFFEADSFDPAWFGNDELALPPIAKAPESLPGPEFQKAMVSLTVDAVEEDALKDAKLKNPKPLADLISEKGHLRTKDARDYVSSVIKGLPQKDGRKKTSVNKDTIIEVVCPN